MICNKSGTGVFILALLLVGIALIPAVSAQEEKDYSVTAEDAFKHANAQIISFIAGNAPGFEKWVGAYIDPKPVELYDINGQNYSINFQYIRLSTKI